jgi:hypothetical protein
LKNSTFAGAAFFIRCGTINQKLQYEKENLCKSEKKLIESRPAQSGFSSVIFDVAMVTEATTVKISGMFRPQSTVGLGMARRALAIH